MLKLYWYASSCIMKQDVMAFGMNNPNPSQV